MLRKLHLFQIRVLVILFVLTSFTYFKATAQDNSPYSRYGLGNLTPTTNVANRGMGGVAAAYNDAYTVNYANPASYSFFHAIPEPNSRKINSGRVAFNIGADGMGRTLIDQNATSRFTSTNVLFSHVMMGAPIRKNWGMAFGLRPLTNIGYKVNNTAPKFDPNTGNLIDSSITLYEGQGGAYLASLGTGVKFKTGESQYLSFGVNAGYMFGSRDYSTRLSFYNDSIRYASANYQNKVSLGGLYFDAGLQYHFKAGEKMFMGLGAYGNWQQKINTNRNQVAETFVYSSQTGNIPVDTAYASTNIKGSLLYPANITGGLMLHKIRAENEAGWQLGADFTHSGWSQYRVENVPDTAVRNSWQAKVGAEFYPVAKKSYLSRTVYRLGFFTGPDYIYARQTQLPVLGISGGLGLLLPFNQLARYQGSQINLSFEYIKRGNKENILRENMYRLSVGFSLTDLWFGGKTKYSDE